MTRWLRIVGKLTAAVLKLLSHPLSVISRVFASLFQISEINELHFITFNQACPLITTTSYYGDGGSHIMKIGNSFFERFEEFKYFGKTWKKQNSIQ